MKITFRTALWGSTLLTAVSLAPSVWAQHSDASTDPVEHAGHTPVQEQQTNGGSGQVTAAQNASQGSACSNCSMMQNRNADGGMMQDHGGGMMENMHSMMAGNGDDLGQDALSAIRAVVSRLEADPDTDWSRINIDALRDHLVDMHEVTMNAEVETSEVDGGASYRVTGRNRTLQAIRTMVPMHANQLSQEFDWAVNSKEIRNGYEVTVTATAADQVARIRALGFYGFLVSGEHHTEHHLAIVGAQSDSMAGGGHSH